MATIDQHQEERLDALGPESAERRPEPQQRSKRSLRERIGNRKSLLLASPFYIVVFIIVLLPLAYLTYAAFQTGSPGAPDTSFTLQNVRDVVTGSTYHRVIINTLKLGAIVTLVSCTLGVVLAWFVARTNLPSKKALELLIPIPLFMSPFAGGVAWVFLGSETAGLINVAYRTIFNAEGALFNIFTFGGLVFTMVLFMTPYAYLFTLGPLRNMDASLEEASRVHGGTYLRTMLRITFPLALPGVASALLMVFVLSSEMFSLPGLIGVPAGYYTLPYFIYQSTSFAPPRWGLAAAAGLALLLVMIVGVSLQRRATRASERFVTVGGKGAGVNQIDIGRWRWLGAGLCYGYVLLALVLPVIALLIGASMRFFTPSLSWELFTLHHWERIFTSERFLSSLKNTLTIATIGPLFGIFIGFMLVYLWQRLRAPFSRTTESVAMMPIAIPGIVLGVGIVWAYVRTPVYGTLAILVIAYVARYLPHTLRIFQSTLVQIDPGLDEASRVSGAGIFRTLRYVTVPLLRHSTLSAWLLLFILMVRELNVAIMVYTSNTLVLPVLLWSEIEGGQYGGAAIVALTEALIVLTAFVIARKILGIDLVSTVSHGAATTMDDEPEDTAQADVSEAPVPTA